MSFITKRERVFNEYDLFELPGRNEGKLKAYASCTDARAWSHFCSDKTEHLVEIIKRNNDTGRAKYIPTNVIVETLMVSKNAEILRLKGKIDEFEQMLAAYDQLDLNCSQKCEIASAHAAIKAANKELDEMCLNLDLSGFTEGIDSEAFETGKSRGDEAPKYKGNESQLSCQMETPKMDTKSNQTSLSCLCDASTNANDQRIDEMQDVIITKDAKLNAMQNTIAVMENDVCEPYCIYAHIYTALEKIFAILCQNQKYKQYLELLSAGRDTRCIDIKGKILFKLKVIEKFCVALIAPCSQEFSSSDQEVLCYRGEVGARIETTYAMTAAESKKPYLDNKRAQLVADIMESDEMKEILSKESDLMKEDSEHISDCFGFDNYSIDTENLMRLKNLQENYDDLMTCYETLKHERDYLQVRCHKYEELEKEFEGLKSQYKEYSELWNEKEHYRKRSVDLDDLKEQYIVLADETSNLETQLKAESEINNIKTISIDDLRNENIALEKKINEGKIAFEKEKNFLQCKLKETECKVMCQEQQIKSLSIQIDKFLEHDHVDPNESTAQSIAFIDEIESHKEQIKNLKEAIFCNEEEKQNLQEGFEEKLKLINDLRVEIEDWKSSYEKTIQRNDYLEKYTENFRDEVQRLIEENKSLAQNVEDQSNAVENLMQVINNKSHEINKLMEQVDLKISENTDLSERLHDLKGMYKKSLNLLDSEKKQAIQSLELSRQESQVLLQKIKDYDQMIHNQDDMTKSLELQVENYKDLQQKLSNRIEANKNLETALSTSENTNSILLKEIQRLREVNNYAKNNINSLQDEKDQYKMSFSLTKKESDIFRESNKQLNVEKNWLENELREKILELESTSHSIQLNKKESSELMDKLQKCENIQDDFNKLSKKYDQEISKNKILQNDLIDKTKNIDDLLQRIDKLDVQNEQLLQQAQNVNTIESSYNNLLLDMRELKKDFDNRKEQMHNLRNTLENKIEENRELSEQIKSLKFHQLAANNNIQTLQNDNLTTQSTLDAIKKDSATLFDRVKRYENLESDYEKLKATYDQMMTEKERLRNELEAKLIDLKRMEQENHVLNSQSLNLLAHSECLEEALITARKELMAKTESPQDSLAEVIQEMNKLKQEKLQNQHKIRNLQDKLDELEEDISNLSEKVMARDDKITVMQKYINKLEVEVRTLDKDLDEVLDTGEQMEVLSYQKVDQSLKKIEAHHSRATHNMKIELAQLQNENAKLEEQLSFTKLKSEESFRDKHKYVSLISHLQNEREIIVTDVKQLELNSVGDSALSTDKCSVEDVLTSLDRIRKYCNARTSKSSLLEQTLLKMQSSSQLLLSKADEAKKIVEKEKQKIINEKEEAIKDRLHTEKQLIDLKDKLENQIALDKDNIKDLKVEILNQKLIIDEINKSTHNYISKLQEELQVLQNMYHNSISKISELQENNNNLSEEKNRNLDLIEKAKLDLEEKSKEVTVLQNHLDKLKKKPQQSVGVQGVPFDNNMNKSVQTDYELFYDEYEAPLDCMEPIVKCKDKKSMDKIIDINIIRTNKPIPEQKNTEFQFKNNRPSVNEVQILTASVEPPFDYVKNSYLNYKLKCLGTGRIEQHSYISCLSDTYDIDHRPSSAIDRDLNDNLNIQTLNGINKKPEKALVDSKTAQKPNLIDIYNRLSMDTISGHDNISNLSAARSHQIDSQSPIKSSAFTELDLTNESFESDCNHFQNSNMFIDSSEKTTDKDLFIIYRDSASNSAYKTQTHDDTKGWQSNGTPEIMVEAVALYPNTKKIDPKRELKKRQGKKHRIENESFFNPKEDEGNEDDSVKNKLNIQIPRVQVGSTSQTSEFDKKSLDSFTLDLYSFPGKTNSDIKINSRRTIDVIQRDNVVLRSKSNNNHPYLETYINTNLDVQDNLKKANNDIDLKIDKLKDTTKHPQDSLVSKRKTQQTNHNILQTNKPNGKSHHKLSRVSADFGLFKTEISNGTSDLKTSEQSDFALQYILESVQKGVDPNHAGTLSILKKLRMARSDEKFNQIKLQVNTDSSQSRLSPSKMQSNEYKTEPMNSHSNSSGRSPKSFKEQSVLVKIDANESYENKINHLTNNLESIEKDYKKKIEVIKVQYDSNIKSIINEHNQGVKSIQSLHEETLQDIIKIHENEVENLRSMSIEAMRKADKLEKENQTLKTKIINCNSIGLDEEPVKMSSPESKRRKKICTDSKMLTKTDVVAVNVNPKTRSHGPCTCSLDVNISDTIRNIFEQVDVEQRKIAEHTYLKYIANKIINNTVETLDAQELSFLHLKICRTWKSKLSREEAFQKRIDSLEHELMNKQRHTQQHIAELDRKVAVERLRLQEVREAVCRSSPPNSRTVSPESAYAPAECSTPITTCNCNPQAGTSDVGERRSAGDLMPALPIAGIRHKRIRSESNRAVQAKYDIGERREPKPYCDERPTRLRRSYDRQLSRSHKK